MLMKLVFRPRVPWLNRVRQLVGIWKHTTSVRQPAFRSAIHPVPTPVDTIFKCSKPAALLVSRGSALPLLLLEGGEETECTLS